MAYLAVKSISGFVIQYFLTPQRNSTHSQSEIEEVSSSLQIENDFGRGILQGVP